VTDRDFYWRLAAAVVLGAFGLVLVYVLIGGVHK
jgi:hypothetical protein